VIAPFLQELEQVFGWLLAASWQASVLALFVLLIQRVLGSRLNPRWRYALWLLVVLRLILPITPESSLSFYRIFPATPKAFGPMLEPMVAPIFVPGENFHAPVFLTWPPTPDLENMRYRGRGDGREFNYVRDVSFDCLTLA